MVEELTIENFEKTITESKYPVIIDFFAKWCSPCKMMAPIFELVSEDYQNRLIFYKVDTEKAIDLAKKNNVSSIPVFIIFQKGKEVGRIIGYKDDDLFKIEINKILSSIHA